MSYSSTKTGSGRTTPIGYYRLGSSAPRSRVRQYRLRERIVKPLPVAAAPAATPVDPKRSAERQWYALRLSPSWRPVKRKGLLPVVPAVVPPLAERRRTESAWYRQGREGTTATTWQAVQFNRYKKPIPPAAPPPVPRDKKPSKNREWYRSGLQAYVSTTRGVLWHRSVYRDLSTAAVPSVQPVTADLEFRVTNDKSHFRVPNDKLHFRADE